MNQREKAIRRGAGVADRAGLENRCGSNPTEGSNPSLSAFFLRFHSVSLLQNRRDLGLMTDVTHILSAIEQGDPHAAEQLLPLVYDELRKLAAQKMAHEAPGQTLEATALVHEAYLRLVEFDKAQHWNSRGHFFAAAAEAMRRILVEEARRKRSLKRGGRR